MSNQVLEALKTVAWRNCPGDFIIDEDDKNRLLGNLRITNSTVSCPANIQIRIYKLKHVKRGAAGGAATGGVAGLVGGALTGVVVGTVVPGIGNLVGILVGGAIGLATGTAGGSAVGAGAGAGIGGLVSWDNPVRITAREVFQELPGFTECDNTVYFNRSN